MKLHLGCGSKIVQGFVNIDIRQDIGVDIVDDISKLTKIPDNYADLIYACHVLEHISRHENINTLKRWYSVLKFGGKLRLAVPDFEKIVKIYNSGISLKQLIGSLYGGQNYPNNCHYYCWDFSTLKEDLLFVGFKEIDRYEWRSTEHCHVDDYSQAYYPHMRKDDGVLMSLNVECTK